MFVIAELILYPYVIFIMCQEEKGASGGVVRVCIVIGMSGMTNQFGSGLGSSLLLPLSLRL